MTKKNKVLLTVLCVCVAALLVALCCLGVTFARYTSSDEAEATVNIAVWDITLTESTSTDVSDIKPSADASGDTTNPRSNDTLVYAGMLTNSGSVAAHVTAKAEITSATLNSDSELTTVGDDNLASIQSHITIDVYYGTTNLNLSGSDCKLETEGASIKDNKISGDDVTEDNAAYLAPNASESSGAVYLYFDVVWTSDTGDSNLDGDTFDNWMLKNIASLTVTLTFNEVQAETQTSTP